MKMLQADGLLNKNSKLHKKIMMWRIESSQLNKKVEEKIRKSSDYEILVSGKGCLT